MALKTAQALAARGIAVLPLYAAVQGRCCCKLGSQCPTPGKHPATEHGWNDATTDLARLPDLFRGRRNLGIALGEPSGGLVVLDVDPRSGGDAQLRDLIKKHGRLPITTVVSTGGGGWHFWFRDDLGEVPRKVKVDAGIDLMSTGTHVVCPPSMHGSGVAYSWKRRAPVAPLPAWLADYAKRRDAAPVNMGGPRADGVIPLGSRNSELTRVAGMLVGRGAPEPLVLSVLGQVNQDLCDPPMTGDELYTLTQSVCRYGPDLRQEPFNDQGNARRLILVHGTRLRYLPTRNTWLTWNGQRWVPDNEEAMRLAKSIPELLDSMAGQENNEKRALALRKWARTSGSRGKLESMLELASTEPSVSVREDELDADPSLLNTPNGVVNLKTGKVIPHAPELLQSRITTCPMIPGKAPNWNKFLKKVLGGDADLARYLATASGYSITGMTSEQVLFLMWGEGQNGKTTFLEALRNILGDYSVNTPFDTFTSNAKGGPRNDIARLAGVRFTLATEGDEGSRLNEALVKRLTGGDVVTARYLFREFFDYNPRFKIWLATNYRPRIRGADFAIWRRIRLVPFNVKISEAEKDPKLPEKLKAEYPQILYWLVRGAMQWHKTGLITAQQVLKATGDYRADQDVLGQFLSECTDEGADKAAPAREVYSAFRQWSLEQGENPWSHRVLKLRLEERGYQRKRRGSGVFWIGLALNADAPREGLKMMVGGGGR